MRCITSIKYPKSLLTDSYEKQNQRNSRNLLNAFNLYRYRYVMKCMVCFDSDNHMHKILL